MPDHNPDAEHQRRLAWVQQVRQMHRWKRAVGVIGCAIAVVLMLWSKYAPASAPAWSTQAGLAVAAASWLLFVYIIVSRMIWVRRNPLNPKS